MDRFDDLILFSWIKTQKVKALFFKLPMSSASEWIRWFLCHFTGINKDNLYKIVTGSLCVCTKGSH